MSPPPSRAPRARRAGVLAATGALAAAGAFAAAVQAQTPAAPSPAAPVPAAPTPAAPPAPRAPADSGAVVRLDAPGLAVSGRPVVLDAAWGDPLVVVDRAGSGGSRVPLAQVRRVEVRRRATRGDASRGARVGALVGMAPSAVLVPLAVREDRRCQREGGYFCGVTTMAAFIGGVALTGVGAGVGALVGHFHRGHRWEPVWLPTRTSRLPSHLPALFPSLRAVPVGTGRGVGLALGGRF